MVLAKIADSGSQPVDGGSPVLVELEYDRYTFQADGTQDVMGIFVNTFFLFHFFLGCGVEVLEEFAESDDMDQFVGDNVEDEREQL
jgi:hypothetical protein